MPKKLRIASTIMALATMNVDALWCLGDVVGYGPDVCAVLSDVRRYADTMPSQVNTGSARKSA